MGFNLSAKNLDDMLPEDYGKGNLSKEEVDEKNKLIKRIQEQGYLIETNLTENSFRNTNLIVFKKDITSRTRVILLFHYRKEGDFYGFPKSIIDEVIDTINKQRPASEYFYLLLISSRFDEETPYFAIPVFFIKNFEIENRISISKNGRLTLNFEEVENGLYLKLKRKGYENKKEAYKDISEFKIAVKDLFCKTLMKRYEEEKEKYNYVREGKRNAKEEILRKLGNIVKSREIRNRGD